jgi:hypothetical protein
MAEETCKKNRSQNLKLAGGVSGCLLASAENFGTSPLQLLDKLNVQLGAYIVGHAAGRGSGASRAQKAGTLKNVFRSR